MKTQSILVRSLGDLSRLIGWLRQVPLRDGFEVVVRDIKSKRSLEQNARYWALLKAIAEGVTPNGRAFDPDTWHEWFAGRLLPMREIVLPNGRLLRRRKSTTELDVGEFSAYMDEIEAWGIERGVWFGDAGSNVVEFNAIKRRA